MDRIDLSKYLPRHELELFLQGKLTDAYRVFGAQFIEELGMHRFLLWAPSARAVSLVGEFNDWHGDDFPMQRFDESFWCCFVPGLKNGQMYKYEIKTQDGETLYKADPFALYSEIEKQGASRIWSLEGFSFSDSDFLKRRESIVPLSSPVSIYELHLESWRTDDGRPFPNYREIADALAPYLLEMGYTHVEIMPITEYPYGGSWGYQVTGYFAPTSRFGTPQDLMYFVDRMHRDGIFVIFDWVPAHFSDDSHGFAYFDGTPLFEPENEIMASHPIWGTQIFDYAKPAVQSFLISSACLFFDLYHIDGLRCDAVMSLIYLDYGRKEGEWIENELGSNINLAGLDFLRNLNRTVLTSFNGVMTIAEDSSAFPNVCGFSREGGLGFSFKWNIGFSNDTLKYLSLPPAERKKQHGLLTFAMLYAMSENFILSFSHDEFNEKSMLSHIYGDLNEKYRTLRASLAYIFAFPGKKLLFMGTDIGVPEAWSHQHSRAQRRAETEAERGISECVKALNKIYTDYPSLYEIDSSFDGFRWLSVDEAERASLAFMRMCPNGKTIVAVFNFSDEFQSNFEIALPQGGRLELLFSSDDRRFGGSGFEDFNLRYTDKEFMGEPRSLKIDIPPLSALYFILD